MARPGRRPKPSGPPGRIRIIGGQWRGRWLSVPAGDRVRPSTDRVRETLFNWLQPIMDGARCLDLFAGTGALGFEAASRGAAQVTLVEHDAQTAQQLHAGIERFGAINIDVVCGDALAFLEHGPPCTYDVIFLDPPYDTDVLRRAAALLVRGGWCAAGARIYVESSEADRLTGLPAEWTLLRETRAGNVRAMLMRASAD